MPMIHSYVFICMLSPVSIFSKLKDFADNNSNKMKMVESSTNRYQQVENTVGKGEIAHYEQFLIFPQFFQKICTADM